MVNDAQARHIAVAAVVRYVHLCWLSSFLREIDGAHD